MAAPAFFKPLLRRIGLLAILMPAQAIWAQTTTTGFDPNVTTAVTVNGQSVSSGIAGQVYALAVQADGKILIGGNFGFLKPNGAAVATKRTNIARVNTDGTLDATFDPEATGTFSNGQVTCIAVQPNGQILIGGYFNSVQPGGTGTPVTRNHIARFNSNGTLDTTFDPDAAGLLDKTFDPTQPGVLIADVSAIAIQSNGQIIIGGGFTQLRPNGAAAAVGLSRIARLNSNGTIDASFNPNANGHVNAIAIQFDGTMVIGGAFTTLNGVTSNYVARLSAGGVLDTTFNPDPNGTVNAVAYQGTKVLIGGSFTMFQPDGSANQTTQNYIARLNGVTDPNGNAPGTLDTSFTPQPSSPVQVIIVQPDGNIVFGGSFVNVEQLAGGVATNTTTDATTGVVTTNSSATQVSTFEAGYLVRVNGTSSFNGEPDVTFTPNPNYVVYALALQSNGQFIVGGAFTQLRADSALTGVARNAIARINADGSLDTNPDPNAAGGIGPVAIQNNDPTGKTNGDIIVGGVFTTLGNVTRASGNFNLAEISPTGVVNQSFDPEPNGAVTAIAIQSNGQIIIGGTFTSLQPGAATNPNSTVYPNAFLARLNTDGSIDTSFNPSPNGAVFALALESDGRLVFGGAFNEVDGVLAVHIARLNTDVSLDGNFFPQPDDEVDAILLEPSDNAVIIGGKFSGLTPESTFTRTEVPFLARVNNTDGSTDPNFLPTPNGAVVALALQSNGQILIGGSFTTLQPGGPTIDLFTSTGTLQPSNFTIYNQRYLARLNADGSLDTSGFNPSPNSVVTTFAVQPNGQILVGGYFTTLQATNGGATLSEIGLARLSGSNGAVDTSFGAFPAGGVVNSIVLDSSGNILLGGNFTAILPTGASALSTQYHIARLTPTGAVDSTFNLPK
jgi:uncharacterized delta-60 repeat protein